MARSPNSGSSPHAASPHVRERARVTRHANYVADPVEVGHAKSERRCPLPRSNARGGVGSDAQSDGGSGCPPSCDAGEAGAPAAPPEGGASCQGSPGAGKPEVPPALVSFAGGSVPLDQVGHALAVARCNYWGHCLSRLTSSASASTPPLPRRVPFCDRVRGRPRGD
jgi:hypothetical protein